MTAGDDFGLHLLVILSIAAAMSLVFQRFRLALVPAYVIGGVVVRAFGSNLITSPETLSDISHLAIILLLFGVGMEIQLSAIRANWKKSVGSGLFAALAVTLVGWPVLRVFGLSNAEALAVSMALSLSSTAVVLRILTDRKELSQENGRVAVAILVTQDLLALIMLASLPFLAGDIVTPESAANPSALLFGLPRPLVVIISAALVVLIGARLIPAIVRESIQFRSVETMLIVSIAMVLICAQLSHTLGFSHEMGAFLAGLALAATPLRHNLSGQIGPLRDLFMAIFFTTLGLEVNLSVIGEHWGVVLLATVALLLVKTVLIGASTWIFGNTARIAIYCGFALAQGGEFSLILLQAAEPYKLLAPDVGSLCVAVVLLSLIITPSLVRFGNSLGERFREIGPPPWTKPTVGIKSHTSSSDHDSAHVIIGGYGPAGKRIADLLTGQNIRYTVIELNPQTVEVGLKAGQDFVFGDISSSQVLESAGIHFSNAIFLTFSDEQTLLRLAGIIRHIRPDIFIAGRVGTVSQQQMALKAGANFVSAEEEAVGREMVDAVLVWMGEHVKPNLSSGANGK